MASYDYECSVHGVFEETHSIHIKLEFCPKCKEEGKEVEVKRVISYATPGTVELTGQDLKDKMKNDAAQFKKDVYSNEKIYSNLIGETVYENLQKKLDKRK